MSRQMNTGSRKGNGESKASASEQSEQLAENGKTAEKDRHGQGAGQPPALMPLVDVMEDKGGITLFADLPGVPKDKLSIQMEADSLTIEGEMSLDMPEQMTSHHAEMKLPRYRRVFSLSKELDADKASAEFQNGVLKLHIPKAEHTQPRKISINVS